jgi:phage baseplate assembly protein W
VTAGPDVAPVALAAGEDVLDRLMAAPGPVVVAMIAAPPLAVERAAIRATVALAAMRRAPRIRVNAVLAGARAAPDGVAGAIAFLSQAAATTGQTIEID